MNVHRSRLGEDLDVENTVFEDFEVIARLQGCVHRPAAAAAAFKPTTTRL